MRHLRETSLGVVGVMQNGRGFAGNNRRIRRKALDDVMLMRTRKNARDLVGIVDHFAG
jgi:hypothetical protein